MRQVTGFQAKDGTFFETREECRYHEAESELTMALSLMHVDALKFFAIIENHPVLIEEYVNARKAFRQANPVRSDGDDTQQDQGNEYQGEGEASPIFSLTSDGREPMPSVGSGTQSEAVRDERAGDGFGSGRDDA